jgi:hypothetical protein
LPHAKASGNSKQVAIQSKWQFKAGSNQNKWHFIVPLFYKIRYPIIKKAQDVPKERFVLFF